MGSTDLTVKQTDLAYELIAGILLFELSQVTETAIQVVSGGANGIDMIGEETVDDLVVNYGQLYLDVPKIFRPDVHQWEDDGTKRGFKSRNLQVAEYCDKLWCIRSIQSKTYGSGWTADRAEEMGKSVNRITI